MSADHNPRRRNGPRRNLRRVILAAILCLAPAAIVLAMAGTMPVVSEGRALPDDWAELRGWPKGTMQMVNNPLRTVGLNPFFSEWPNDREFFAMKVRNRDDVQHLITLLTAIDSQRWCIDLDPGAEAGTLQFMTALPAGNGIGTVFDIGSQKRINQWFESLPQTQPSLRKFVNERYKPALDEKLSVRKFGNQLYTEPPPVGPPRLTLYVRHPAVDLEKLQVPIQVEVRDIPVNEEYRAAHKNDPAVLAIARFIADHEAKRKTAAATQPSLRSATTQRNQE